MWAILPIEGKELPSIWYRLLYSYVKLSRITKIVHYNRILQLATLLSPLNKVVDVGAGYGIVADLIHQGVRTLYLVEKDLEILSKSTNKMKKLENVEKILAEATNLPFISESMDLVYFHDSLNEMSNKISALREAARIVKRGGCLAVFDWDKKRLMTKIKEILLNKAGFPVNCSNMDEIVCIIGRMGLKIILAQSNIDGSMTILAQKTKENLLMGMVT
ncbi:MAG TPA: class I SAM-dependent methyltransferase [Candidatus Korarchaeota archaeon]|nr:class I SAM-dependent methyltransferase [Candidatus Korarchaeota archaeon]